MPSGDAIQGALFTVFLLHLGVHPLYAILFHVAVCIGRVYYMCHWVADTVAATILGVTIGNLFIKLVTDGFFEGVPISFNLNDLNL